MFEINIIKPDEPMTTASLQPGIYRIGKSPASHIQLNSPEVSSRHAVLNVQEGSVTVSDVGSTNGTFVDGERIDPETEITLDSGVELKIGAKIIIKIFDPSIPREEPEPELDDEPQEDLAPLEEGEPVNAKSSEGRIARADREDMIMLSGIRWEYRKVAQEIKQSVHAELLKRMNLKNLTLSGADPEEIKKQALETITIILKELSSQIPRGVDISILEEELVNEAVALGPLERLLADESVTEVMVNGYESVYIEKEGLLRRTDLTFADNNQVITVIERIVAPLGRRIDESSPMVDARLPDGSRVNAIIPPLAIDGPSLTIRKFSKKAFTVDDLINFGSLTGDIAEFLKLAVLLRKNILISGGTGSGKTSLLNVVSNFLPNTERIVTIEDAAELRINKDHVVRLEARPPNIEGRGEIAIRDLVRNSLRMRPDRIVIGECRGGEALDMLQAMNTGHDGSLTTVHANTARDALARLETLVLMAGFDLPLRAIREQIASAISIIIQIGRMKDGTRKVLTVTEITGMEGEVITSQDLFEFTHEGFDENGKVKGTHKSCGIVPSFIEEIQLSEISFNLGIFSR